MALWIDLSHHLVAKEYTQTQGLDYNGTFSPVVKLNSVRILIYLIARFDCSLHQLDVANAFFHGDLQVYMQQSPRFVDEGKSNKVCHLPKSIYGLKQSPCA